MDIIILMGNLHYLRKGCDILDESTKRKPKKNINKVLRLLLCLQIMNARNALTTNMCIILNQIEIKYLSQTLNVRNFILFTVQFEVYYKDDSVVPALDKLFTLLSQ